MNEPVKWVDEKAAAAEAVVFGLLEDTFKELKEEARLWLSNRFKESDSRGVDAYSADGTLIGSVTRSKPSEKVDVVDSREFLGYVVDNCPEILSVEYHAKTALLRSLTEVEGQYIDADGVPVPGVGKRVSYGTVRVNKDKAARDAVRALLANGSVGLDGIKQLPVLPEPTNRFEQDREAAGF